MKTLITALMALLLSACFANPVKIDRIKRELGSDGLARFYADAGVYKITATHTLVSSSFRNQQLGNAASR